MKRNGILIKSDRAIFAEERGLRPYSRLQPWQKRAVDCGMVISREWHHTSAAANITEYYFPGDFYGLNPADFPYVEPEKATQGDLKRIKIRITYRKMVSGFGQYSKKKFETVTVEGVDVRKKDNKIIGAGGRRLSSNNEEIEIFYLPPRCRKWRSVSKKEAEELGYSFG